MADSVQKFLNGVANPQNMLASPWNGNQARNQLSQAGQNWNPANRNAWPNMMGNGAPNANNWGNNLANGMANAGNNLANGMANVGNGLANGMANAGNGLGSALSTMNYNDLADMDLYMADVEICEEADQIMGTDSCRNPQKYLMPLLKKKDYNPALRNMQADAPMAMGSGWNGPQGMNPSDSLMGNYSVAGAANGKGALKLQLPANANVAVSPDGKSLLFKKPGLYNISMETGNFPGQLRNARLMVNDGIGNNFASKTVGRKLMASVPVSANELGSGADLLSLSLVGNGPLPPFSGRFSLTRSPLMA